MSEPVTNSDGDQPRDGRGKFRKTLQGYERDAEACRMYVSGRTYLDISDELGYGSLSNARRAIKAVLLETVAEPADEVRALLRARNEEIYILAREIALKNHLAHGNGRVVIHEGKPLIDDGPKLNAMDRMQRALSELAKLAGAHAPQKFENLTLEAVQAEIIRLEADMAARDRAEQEMSQ